MIKQVLLASFVLFALIVLTQARRRVHGRRVQRNIFGTVYLDPKPVDGSSPDCNRFNLKGSVRSSSDLITGTFKRNTASITVTKVPEDVDLPITDSAGNKLTINFGKKAPSRVVIKHPGPNGKPITCVYIGNDM
jgi:hypothetical protein